MARKSLGSYLWDLWCVVSVIGIWPRFIEPSLLDKKQMRLAFKGLSRPLKLAFFSDLHWNPSQSKTLLRKLQQSVSNFDPDVILMGGDFICEGELWDEKGLEDYLKGFSAKLGKYAVLGNHDYDAPLSINEAGDYDVTSKGAPLGKILTRLFKLARLSGRVTDRAKKVSPHAALNVLLQSAGVSLLNNRAIEVEGLNLVGLGEYMADKADPKAAFKEYDPELAGVVMVHNPDFAPRLKNYPGKLILSGHTHGGQVNLPWIWRRLTAMEDFRFKSGERLLDDKLVYTSRGVGSLLPFRWFAMPEVVFITLEPYD